MSTEDKSSGSGPDPDPTPYHEPASTHPPLIRPGPTDSGEQSSTESEFRDASEGPAFAAEARRARVLLTDASVDGDFIAGNKYVLQFKTESFTLHAFKVSPDELYEPFVEPNEYAGLAARSRESQIVLLSGPNGIGKGATLRNLLTSARARPDVYQLRPDTDLSKLKLTRSLKGAVLILQGAPQEMLRRLDYLLPELVAELRNHDARLGIATEAPSPVEGIAGCSALTLERSVSPRDVYEQHLEELLLGKPDADTLQAESEIQSLVHDELDTDTPLRQAARLARLVAEHGASLGGPAKIKARLTGLADAECAEWFESLSDIRAHCMAVSIAVLGGTPRDVLAPQSTRLLKHVLDDLAPSDRPLSLGVQGDEPSRDNPFDAIKRLSLTRLRAHVVLEPTLSSHGIIPMEVLQFREPGFASTVLGYVWRHHDLVRPAVTTWMREMAEDEDLRVRARAAASVGLVATVSLDAAVNDIVLPWSCSPRPYVRECAAAALAQLGESAGMREPVRALVADWSRSANSRTRATAARAYAYLSSTFGARDTLSHLHGMAERDSSFVVLAAVSISYADLVTARDPQVAAMALLDLELFGKSRKSALSAVSSLSALALAKQVGPAEFAARKAQTYLHWPTAIALCQERPQQFIAVARLLGRAITSTTIAEAVRQEFTSWAESAERVSAQQEPLLSALSAISDVSPRSKLAIRRLATRWSGRQGSAHRIGSALLEIT